MRVFVTGMGAMTSLGNGVNAMFEGLLENRTGVRFFPEWASLNGLSSHLGAPAPDYDIAMIPRSARRTMSRMSEMASVATMQALQEANLQIQSVNTKRTLLCMGSTTGSPITLETYFRKFFDRGGPEGQLSSSFFKVMNHSVPANVAAGLGYYGPLLSPSSACASSAQAMIMGWELIQSGLYDVVIAGGADELHPLTAAIFDIVQAASRNYNNRPDLAPSPFDQHRDGLVVSEGAGIVILESEASVKARGVLPKVEFCGGAYICDGTHMSQSNAKTMVDVMKAALTRSCLKISDVQYINAHATGTLQGDQEEAAAIREVFGSEVPVSSLKGHLGHSLAACGALEVIASVKMMEKNVLIPTRNLREVDPACSGILHVQRKQESKIRTVLSNNFAFGGMNTTLLLTMKEGNS